MRRLGSEKQEEKRRKQFIMFGSLFLLFILIIGTIGYAFISSPDDEETTEISENIYFQGNLWVVNHNNNQFYFTNSPESESINEIPVEVTIPLTNYVGKTLYIDSKSQVIYQEIGRIFQNYATHIQEGCYGSCPERDIPEKTCEENVIIWRDSTEDRIYQEENCIFIEGDMETVDAFLFKILGISN